MFGIKIFSDFLALADFVVESDHKALEFLLKAKNTNNAQLNRWALELQRYAGQMRIVHRSGTSMVDADIISRNLPDTESVESENAEATIIKNADEEMLLSETSDSALYKMFSVQQTTTATQTDIITTEQSQNQNQFDTQHSNTHQTAQPQSQAKQHNNTTQNCKSHKTKVANPSINQACAVVTRQAAQTQRVQIEAEAHTRENVNEP